MGKCNFKRMLILLLALVTVAVLCPAAPTVQAEDTDLCPCCGDAINNIRWTSCSWEALMLPGFLGGVDLSKGGHYKITESFAMPKEYSVAAEVTIDFNGYLLRADSRGFTVKDGGTLTLMNTGGENGGLQGRATSGHGGAVYVEAGGTLNIYGGTVAGSSTTGHGGTIYNAGTVNLHGGTVKGGSVSGENRYGGNIYNRGTLEMSGGTVEDGTSQHYGGNLFLSTNSTTNIYGGTISNGTVTGGDGFAGHGGNIYVTGAAKFNIYGGLITGGQNTYSSGTGGNLRINSGAQVYMYGGTIENGSANKGGNVYVIGSDDLDDNTKQYSALYILGGTITAAENDTADLQCATTNNVIKMYNCRYNGNVSVTGFVADCCCRKTDKTGVTVWHPDTCTTCIFAVAKEAELVTPVAGGGHSYKKVGDNYTCAVCNDSQPAENVEAIVNGILFNDVTEALENIQEGDTVQLLKNVTVNGLAVPSNCTLDLYGHTLTVVETFNSTATGSNVIDTSDGAGMLVADDVTLPENNSYLPIAVEGGYRFCEVGFTQQLKRVDENTTKVEFYFTQRAKDTIIDEAVKGDSTEIGVQIRLTWTDSEGIKQDVPYSFSQDQMQDYAKNWDRKVFVATIKGVENVSDLTCTWQVTSNAATGTKTSATTLKNVAVIQDKLSWDAIDDFDIKSTNMTVEEMRNLCVDFFRYSKTALWTPDQDVKYQYSTNGNTHTMKQGTIYGGFPYVPRSANGNVYRLLDYMDPLTGLVDMKKAIPALGTKDTLEVDDLKHFGNQCVVGAYWGWGRVMNSATYDGTAEVVPYNGFVFLGDVEIDQKKKEWTASYNTFTVCEENGENVLYDAYADLQKADGLVYFTPGGAGHVIMVVANDPDAQKITFIDQSTGTTNVASEDSDSYSYWGLLEGTMTYEKLYKEGYLPFTFKEFLDEGDSRKVRIEKTTVSLVDSSGIDLVSGTVSETEDRSFEKTTIAPDTLTWSQLFSSTIKSNYGIADAYIIVTDNNGNEIYRHAVRAFSAGAKELKLQEEDVQGYGRVTIWETRPLLPGRTCNMRIEVQLATGERPVIYEGQLTR